VEFVLFCFEVLEVLIDEDVFEYDEFLFYWVEFWLVVFVFVEVLFDVCGFCVVEFGCGFGVILFVVVVSGVEVVVIDWVDVVIVFL